MEGKKRLFHINLGPSKVTLQQKRKEKKKDPYFQNKFIQIFFLKENYDTRPTKKKNSSNTQSACDEPSYYYYFDQNKTNNYDL